MGNYSHLKNVSDKIHLSGGAIDLIGTDFAEAFIDIHTVSGRPGEPVAKRNCLDGTLWDNSNQMAPYYLKFSQ